MGLTVSAFGAEGAKMPPPALVQAEKATILNQDAGKNYIGRVEAINEVAVPSRVSDVIKKVHFKEGAYVNAGDLLYEIDDTDYVNHVDRIKAQGDEIKAELIYAEENFKRYAKLHETNATSKSDYDSALRLRNTVASRLRLNDALLQNAERELSHTKIYAPISGRIGRSVYSVGNYITPASGALAHIVQIDPIYVRFAISERDFQDIANDAPDFEKNNFCIIKQANNELFNEKTKLSFFDNKVDASTGTIAIWLECENPERILVPDGWVSMTLGKKLEESPAIRISAVGTDNEGAYVYVVKESTDGSPVVPEKRRVVRGGNVGNLQIINSGLAKDELVITEGMHKIRPGLPVTVTVKAAANDSKALTVK